MAIGVVKTERELIIYKCNKYPEKYFALIDAPLPKTDTKRFNIHTIEE
jgi:hypothetical protein